MKRAFLTVLARGAFIVENSFDFVGSVPYFKRLTAGLGILECCRCRTPSGPTARSRCSALTAGTSTRFCSSRSTSRFR